MLRLGSALEGTGKERERGKGKKGGEKRGGKKGNSHSLRYGLGGHLPLVGQLVLEAFHLFFPLWEIPLVHRALRGLRWAGNGDMGLSSSCPDPGAPQRLPRDGDSVSRALGEVSKPTAEQPKGSGSFWGCCGLRQRLPRAPLMQNAEIEADLTEIWAGSSGEQPEALWERDLCAFPAWTRL